MEDNNVMGEVDFEIEEVKEKGIASEPKIEEDIIIEDLDEDDEFEIIEEDEEHVRDKAKARKSKMIKLIIIAILALVVCSVGCYTFITKRAELDKLESALYNSQYSNAKQIYSRLMDSQQTNADGMIEERTKVIYAKYYKGNVDSDKAIKELKELDDVSINKIQAIADMLALFKDIQESENNYALAGEQYKEGNFSKSIIYYKKIIKEDAHYKKAQGELKKVSAEYRNMRVEEAEEYAEQEDYDNAIKVMESALKVLEDDEDTLKQLQVYKSAKLTLEISDIMDKVNVYVKNKEYVKAIKVIKQSMEEFGEDVRLVETMTSLKEEMYKLVDEYIKSERYTVAVTMLKEYSKIIVDEKAVTIIQEYSSKVETGAYLAKLKTKKEEGKAYTIEDIANYKDANDNKYESVIEVVGYRNLDKEGNFVYENTGYSKLTGSIGYVNSADIDYYKDGAGIVHIYGDDKEIYKSQKMTEKSKNESVDLDVSKYKTIKITWEPADKKDVKTYGIVLGDFMFSK